MAKITFVTGKGGVGKTRISLWLAKQNPTATLSEWQTGLKEEAKILNIPLPKHHSFSRAELAENFLVSALKIRMIAHWISQTKIFQALLRLAPNLYEILMLEAWFREAEKRDLIVDAPSTGHFLALFEANDTALRLFDGGSLRAIAKGIQDKLLDGKDIEIHIVCLPENSALEEAKQIQEFFKSRYPKIKVSQILNRIHRAPPTPFEVHEPLKSFILERVEKETARTQHLEFAAEILEGEF